MQAIILVGGFGTRLKSVVTDLPKPMAPIADQPFLAHLLNYLGRQGVTRVVFPVHYLREKIEHYFKDKYNQIKIDYVVEDEPLGTGGAIVNAIRAFDIKDPVFVLNGDTFVKLDYLAMNAKHHESQAKITMALRHVDDCGRYGSVTVRDHHAVQFQEKGKSGAGYINAGVYLINPELFAKYTFPKKFSFETEFLFPYMPLIKPNAFIAEDYFIDIGIPEDYARAQQELVGVLG